MTPQQLKIDLVRETDFLIEETDTDIFITGTSFSLPAFNLKTWGTKNLIVQAYDLTLVENLTLPRKNVSISCRYLRVFKPLTISVSGTHGKTHNLPANNGRQPGAEGGKGAPGRNGTHAGNIEITFERFFGEILTLAANGGNGAQGQNGGNGITGRRGENAPHRRGDKTAPGIQGGPGKDGGKAGIGGVGGNAGNGGIININSDDPLLSKKIAITVEKGTEGTGGSHGDPGSPGLGGSGGAGIYCWWEAPVRRGSGPGGGR